MSGDHAMPVSSLLYETLPPEQEYILDLGLLPIEIPVISVADFEKGLNTICLLSSQKTSQYNSY